MNRQSRNDHIRKNGIGRGLSMVGTTLIVVVIILCSLLVLPGIFGFHMYHVLSGSMEPAIRTESLIYVRGGAPEEVEEEDIIAFYGLQDTSGTRKEEMPGPSEADNDDNSDDNSNTDLPGDGGIITHRVVKNNVVSGTFKTKGDANDSEDPMPVPYSNYIGKVMLVIPYMGKVMTIMTSFYGKISAALVIVLGAVLNMIGM